MPAGLSVNALVNVTVTLTPLAVPLRNFGVPLFVDDTQGVIDVSERLREYFDIEQVEADWSNTSGAYKAALAYFSQNPQPQTCWIGFWASTDTPAILHGGLLTPSQQLLSNFTSVTTGAFFTYINGVPHKVSLATLAGQVSINGVAGVLQTALATENVNSTAVWNSSLGRFDLTIGSTGATAAITVASAPRAFNFAHFTTNPTAGVDTITVNAREWSFVSAVTTGFQILVGPTLPDTLDNIVTSFNSVVDPTDTSVGIYSQVAHSIYMVSKIAGTAGDLYTLAYSSSAIDEIGGATWSGGTGTDASTLFGLTAAMSATAVGGAAAEEPVDAFQTMADISGDWYAGEIVSNVQPTDAQHEAAALWFEANSSPSRMYLYTTAEQRAMNAVDSSDIGSAMETLTLARTFGQYCSSSVVAVASAFGRMATTNYSANNTVINLMWKREPGITPETLTASQAAALKAKHLNVFVKYQNNTAIIQWGQMANGDYIDERIGLDWFQNLVQTTLWNVLYQTPTKIPQTDAGQLLLITPAKQCCVAAVNNGLVAPGIWRGPPIGKINTGDALPLGYYVFSDIYANQNQADREARKAMPIQIALKLAGAVNTVDVLVTVNR